MTFRSARFWWLQCNVCGLQSSEDGDYMAWPSQRAALEALDGAWTDVEGKHYCAACSDDLCWRCSRHDPEPGAGDRGYLCVSCAQREEVT